MFMVFILLASGLAEALSFAALIPLIGIALGQDTSQVDSSLLQRSIHDLFFIVGMRPSIGNILFLISISITIKSFLSFYSMKEVGYICANIEADFRHKISNSLLNADWKYFLGSKAGDFSSAIGTQAQQAAGVLRSISLITANAVQVCIFIAMSLMISIPVTLVGVVLGFVVMIMLRKYVGISRISSKKITKHQGVLLSSLIDGLKGIKTYKSMVAEHFLVKYLKDDIDKLAKMRKRVVYSNSVIKNFQEPVQIISIALVLYFLSQYWQDGVENLIVLILILYRVGQKIGFLQVYYQQTVSFIPSFWFVTNIVQSAEENKEDISSGMDASMGQSINFSNISFSYKDKSIFENTSLCIKSGEFVSIVGGSGEGKTTLIDMLLGFNKPDFGEILFDNKPIELFSKKSLRTIIGYVPQDVTLFHDTVKNNITFGDTDVSDKVVKDALISANAMPFVSNFTGGMDFIVGEHGGRLSGGQRQRIGIARALLNKPKILILDEATSALDKASERNVLEALQELHGNVTIIAISHRDTFIEMADRVVLLSNGKLTEVES